jgi:hypothetical protein
MALNFLPSTNYETPQAAWTAMINAAEFWDSVDGNTATVGGLTLGFDAGTNVITISGYGLSSTSNVINANGIMIATTEKSLLISYTASSGGTKAVLMLNKNSDNEWGAAELSFSGTTIGRYIAPSTTGTDLALKNDNILTATLTQLVPLTGKDSTWVMDNAYLVLSSPNPTYAGKMELNGVKYVMAGRAAISYTD